MPEPDHGFCLDVACMVLDDTNRLMDEYEQDVDAIIAACRGDLRGAVKALMLINEQLEQTLRQLSAVSVEKAGEDQYAWIALVACIEIYRPDHLARPLLASVMTELSGTSIHTMTLESGFSGTRTR
jgi:hypothetical protein